MNKNDQRLTDHLNHIVQAIERIEIYTEDLDENTFLDNLLVQDAVVRNLEVIGEVSNNIKKHYPDFYLENPELPLSFAYEMRNVLVHGYFQVDFEIVWRTIQTDLPGLCDQVTRLVKSHQNYS